mmetsp:Transcript_1439/g.3200  ORF Transcript_1439/g.3200 Transcript_1439/m.3200 type:complete len:292 (-) Transcript_1439:135-1010(-)
MMRLLSTLPTKTKTILLLLVVFVFGSSMLADAFQTTTTTTTTRTPPSTLLKKTTTRTTVKAKSPWLVVLSMSSELREDTSSPSSSLSTDPESTSSSSSSSPDTTTSDDEAPLSPSWKSWWNKALVVLLLQSQRQEGNSEYQKPPPIQVDDFSLLYYDIFLLLNLSVSISVWVVHRMQPLQTMGVAFNEGCLLSLCWLAAGLYTGAFLDSAVDGHYGSADPRGGPPAAAKLAVHTFINAMNVRLLVALCCAIAQHRPVGSIGGEALLPLELGLGLVLMPAWRMLHSSYLPRM